MYEFLEYRVADVMTPDPISIAPEAPIAEAQRLFAEHDFNALPVLDAEGTLVGVLTKLDVLRAFRFTEDHMFPPYAEIVNRPVAEVMSRDVLRVAPRTPLTRVLEKLIDTRSKSFPVVDGERLVGMVSREDVLAGLERAVAGEKPTSAI